MSLMNLLKQAQGGGGLESLAGQLGLDAGTAEALASQFAPAISSGMKQRAKAEGGMGAVLGALKGNGATGFLEQPAEAASAQGQAQGAAFLSQIFGQEEAAPALAQAAAERTGATAEQASAFLPALAAMVQGGLQKQAPDSQIDGMMQGLSASGGDTAGAGLSDLMSMIPGQSGGGGGLLGGIMGALTGKKGASGSGELSGVLQMLDADGDGSPLDDIMGKFMS